MKFPIFITFVVVHLAIIAIALVAHHLIHRTLQEGFSFSPVKEDAITEGNPSSWSNIPNPRLDINLKGKNRDPVIYQASGVPLLHEDHPTVPVEKSMFYFDKYACRPECCQYSAFSCSNGCVCWEAPPDKPVEQNAKISPRS